MNITGIARIMNTEELKRICQEQIDLGMANPQIALKQPGRWGKRDYRLLFGVKGEIVRDNFGDGMVVMYPAKELLAAISLAPLAEWTK